jgi:hypothetical protein
LRAARLASGSVVQSGEELSATALSLGVLSHSLGIVTIEKEVSED